MLRDHPLLAFALVCFVGVQCYLSVIHDFPLTRRETDSVPYMDKAQGPIFHLDAFHGPGYSWAIRTVRALTPFSLFASAKAVSALAGLLFILSSYVLGRRLFGPVAAGLGVVLTALNPITLQYGTLALSDLLAASCAVSSLACCVLREEVRPRDFLIAGLFAGAAYLSRYIYVSVIVFPMLILASRKITSRSFVCLGFFFLSFILVVAPWAIYLTVERGNPMWSYNHLNVGFKLYGRDRGFHTFPSIEEFSSLGTVYARDPALFVGEWLKTLRSVPLRAGMLVLGPGYLFAVAGLFFWLRRFAFSKLALLIFYSVYAILLSLVWIEPRFLIGFIPLTALLVGAALEAIPRRIDLSGGGGIPLRIPIFLFVLSFSIAGFKPIHQVIVEDQAEEYQLATEWLIAQGVTAETKIMASKPYMAFFAGAERIDFRKARLQFRVMADLKKTLAELEPDYFIYDARFGAVNFPQYADLLDPTNAPAFLRPVYKIDGPYVLVIYRYGIGGASAAAFYRRAESAG